MSLVQLNDPPDFRPVRSYTCWICRDAHTAEGPERIVLVRGLFFCESCLRFVLRVIDEDPATPPAASPEPTDTG